MQGLNADIFTNGLHFCQVATLHLESPKNIQHGHQSQSALKNIVTLLSSPDS